MPYFQMPVKGRLTDPFGWRGEIPGVVGAQLHSGRDIAADAGTPIYAAAPGTVSRVWWDTFANGAGAGGWMVEIDHGDGIATRYAHMKERSWRKPGERVVLESVIGHVGSTGAATGPHLHFEVLINGQFVDPDLYLHPRVGSKPTPKPQPKPVIEEDPMPKRHYIKEYKPNKTYPAGQWSTLPINSKGDVTLAFSGAKAIIGTTHLTVHAEGEFLLRFVYDEVVDKGSTVKKRSGGVQSRHNRAGIHAWPISLPAKTAKKDTRLRAQIYPLGGKPMKVTAVVANTDYWEK